MDRPLPSGLCPQKNALASIPIPGRLNVVLKTDSQLAAANARSASHHQKNQRDRCGFGDVATRWNIRRDDDLILLGDQRRGVLLAECNQRVVEIHADLRHRQPGIELLGGVRRRDDRVRLGQVDKCGTIPGNRAAWATAKISRQTERAARWSNARERKRNRDRV